MVTQSLSQPDFGEAETQSLEDIVCREREAGWQIKWLQPQVSWQSLVHKAVSLLLEAKFLQGTHSPLSLLEWFSAPCPQISFKEYDEPGTISCPASNLPAFWAKFSGELLNENQMTKWMNSEWYKISSFNFFQENAGHSTLLPTCLLIKHQRPPFSEYLPCARHHAKLCTFQSSDWLQAGPWANYLSLKPGSTLASCVTLGKLLNLSE